MKKIGYFGFLLLTAAIMLTGCATNADTLASPTPGTNALSPSTSPDTPMSSPMLTTQVPILSDMEQGLDAMMGLNSLQDVQRASEEMEDAVEQLSEVDDAYVIAHEDTALVGLELNSQYQGQVDERLEKMVLGRVQTIEKSISGVAVTAEKDKVQQIRQLAQQLDNAQNLAEVTQQMEAIVSGLTVYQE